MNYKLSEKALQRITEISDYISFTLFNKQAAINLIDEIMAKMKIVCQFPLSNKEFYVNDIQYRRTFVNSYVIIYHIKNNLIIVDTVQYASKDPKNIVKDLTIN